MRVAAVPQCTRWGQQTFKNMIMEADLLAQNDG